jgi:hypothetical protein
MVTIETIKNGPYIVTGEVELIDADGNKFSIGKTNGAVSLWRVDGKTVLRRHTFEDRLSSCRESRAGIERITFVIPSEVEESLA